MAHKATIFKATLNIADMDRHYYADHALTIARHPSETDERMMLRVLAYALHAHDDLAFGRGLSTEDEPDLWLKDLTGDVELWIDLGQPDERRVRRACSRARQVAVYAYGGRAVPVWWEQHGESLSRLDNLAVYNVPVACTTALATLASRNMNLQCMVQDGEVWLSDDDNRVNVTVETLDGE